MIYTSATRHRGELYLMVSNGLKDTSTHTSTRFARPRLLRVLQVAFFTITALSVVRIIVTLPDYYAIWFKGYDFFGTVIHTDLASMGITPQGLAIYNIAVVEFVGLFSTGLGF